MHIVMLSDIDTQGGAAVASCRLAEALCGLGHRVTRLINNAATPHLWQTISLLPKFAHTVTRRLMPGRMQERWEQTAAEERLDRALAQLCPDVINVHNLHSAGWSGWSPEMVGVCARYAPVVWTLHDMWSFTGRCAYSYGCRQFITGCTATCPTAGEYPQLVPERIAGAWEYRRQFFHDNPDMVAVTPSQWLAGEAKRGLWRDHQVKVIPNGLPLSVYRPLERAEARKQLQIETNGPTLLVAANDFNERRKGGSLFREALSSVSVTPLTVIVMGAGELNLSRPSVQVRHLGYIDNEEQKVLAYSAADIYVHAAPVDNLPNMVLESIACGTPVVGFAIGGVPDMVRLGVTGWLSDTLTPGGLACEIDTALEDIVQGQYLRSTCRAVADTEYDATIQARNYLSLFTSLITGHTNHQSASGYAGKT